VLAMAISAEQFVQNLFDLDDEIPLTAEEVTILLDEAGIDVDTALAAALKLCNEVNLPDVPLKGESS